MVFSSNLDHFQPFSDQLVDNFSQISNEIPLSKALKVINPDHFLVNSVSFWQISTNSKSIQHFGFWATFLTRSPLSRRFKIWTSSPSDIIRTLKRGFRDPSGPSMSSLNPFGSVTDSKKHSLTFWSIGQLQGFWAISKVTQIPKFGPFWTNLVTFQVNCNKI